MVGAIAGDVIGSVFEWNNVKTTEFPLFSPGSTFTDDTVLSVATAQVLLDGGDYAETYRNYFHHYPASGYGARFRQWACSPSSPPYHSFGNGSAMRVGPVGHALDDLDQYFLATLEDIVDPWAFFGIGFLFGMEMGMDFAGL
jgi:ADP-ribosylglycohydrolase